MGAPFRNIGHVYGMIKTQGKIVEIRAFSIIERTLMQSYSESLKGID